MRPAVLKNVICGASPRLRIRLSFPERVSTCSLGTRPVWRPLNLHPEHRGSGWTRGSFRPFPALARQPSPALSSPLLLWVYSGLPSGVPAYDGRGSYRLLSVGSLTSLPQGETLRSLPNVTAWAGRLDPQRSWGETAAQGGLSLKVQLS